MLTSGDYMAMIQAMIQSNVLDNLDPNGQLLQSHYCIQSKIDLNELFFIVSV